MAVPTENGVRFRGDGIYFLSQIRQIVQASSIGKQNSIVVQATATNTTKTASKMINNLKAALTSIDNSLTKRPRLIARNGMPNRRGYRQAGQAATELIRITDPDSRNLTTAFLTTAY